MADNIILYGDNRIMNREYKRTLRDWFGGTINSIKRVLNVNTARSAYRLLDDMYSNTIRQRIIDLRVRRQQLQNILQRQMARRIQQAFRGRGVPLEDWVENVRGKLNGLFGNYNTPFTLTIRSTEALGVSRSINFNNYYHFRNWVNSILDNQVEGDSASLIRYRDIIGDVGDVFRNSRLEVKPIQGGCSQNGRGGEKNITGRYNHYKIVNPQVQHNNCGLKCVEILLDTTLDYKIVRKDFGLKYNDLITPTTLKDIYYKYSEEEKFLSIIDRDFPNVMDFTICDYIIYEKNHYRAVLSSKGQKGAFKKVDNKVRRCLLAYDIETRIIDHSKGIKTGQSMRFPQVDVITSIHYEEKVGKGGKNIINHTKTFITTGLHNRSIRQFADWLIRESSCGRHYTVVAHNGSRFDNLFFQSVLTDEEKLHSDFKYRGYSLIGIAFMNHIFRDPCCFLMGSLDTLCKNFKVKNAKMTDNIFIGNDTYLDNKQLCFYKPDLDLPEFLDLQLKEPQYWKAYVEYCEMDCISLLELYKRFKTQTEDLLCKMGSSENNNGAWILRSCSVITKTTIGGLARKVIDTLNKKSKVKNIYDEFIGTDEDKYNYIFS